MDRMLDYLPHGDLVDDEQWGRCHRFLLWVLASLCYRSPAAGRTSHSVHSGE